MSQVDMTVIVKTSTGKTFQLVVSRAASVLEVKERCVQLAEVPSAEMRLIYKGRALEEGLVTEYDVEDQATIHLLSAPPRAPVRPQQQQLAANGLLAGGLDQAMPTDPAALQRRMMNDPELTARILNSPMTRSLLDDPNMLRQMVNANPQLRRAMDANPALRHALNDPSVLREAVEVARNPARAREAMRQQDLSMSQIESHPEGFNALRRMYSEVQEPLMEGLMTNSSSGGNVPPADVDPNSPMPNPWARPQQAPRDLPLPGPMPFDPQLMASLMGGGGPRGHIADMFDVFRAGVAPASNPARPPPPAANPWAHIGEPDDDDDIYG